MTRNKRPLHDYSDRSGFPDLPAAMRGAAKDFEAPRDMRAPLLMRPWIKGSPPLGTYDAPAEDLPETVPPIVDIAGR